MVLEELEAKTNFQKERRTSHKVLPVNTARNGNARCDLCKFAHPVSISLRDINNWTCVQVYDWLEQVCASRFTLAPECIIGKLEFCPHARVLSFGIEQHVDGSVLLDLDHRILKEMGVKLVGHRQFIIGQVRQLKKCCVSRMCSKSGGTPVSSPFAPFNTTTTNSNNACMLQLKSGDRIHLKVHTMSGLSVKVPLAGSLNYRTLVQKVVQALSVINDDTVPAEDRKLILADPHYLSRISISPYRFYLVPKDTSYEDAVLLGSISERTIFYLILRGEREGLAECFFNRKLLIVRKNVRNRTGSKSVATTPATPSGTNGLNAATPPSNTSNLAASLLSEAVVNESLKGGVSSYLERSESKPPSRSMLNRTSLSMRPTPREINRKMNQYFPFVEGGSGPSTSTLRSRSRPRRIGMSNGSGSSLQGAGSDSYSLPRIVLSPSPTSLDHALVGSNSLGLNGLSEDAKISQNLLSPCSPAENSQRSLSTQVLSPSGLQHSRRGSGFVRDLTVKTRRSHSMDCSRVGQEGRKHSAKSPDMRTPPAHNHLLSPSSSSPKNRQRRVSKFSLGQVLGQGSFGKVFMCIDSSTLEIMAMKQVQFPDVCNNDDRRLKSRKEEILNAINVEIDLLKRLEHRNVVQYIDSHYDSNNCFNIFLEYVSGGTLKALIKELVGLDERLIRSFTSQILQGLDYIHSQNVIHRDIKASNILVTEDGRVKISDFGISKKLEDQNTINGRHSKMKGTVYWMAPETVKYANKVTCTGKVDIWGLGCVIIEMITNCNHPWAFEPNCTDASGCSVLFKLGNMQRPPIPDSFSISRQLRDLMDQCFIKLPEERPCASSLSKHSFLSIGSITNRTGKN